MSFESEFDELLGQSITITPVSTRDEFGDTTYGTAVTYSARIVEKLQQVVDFTGRETIATHVMWVRPHAASGIPNVGPDSLVTLPDGTTPQILRIETYPDEDSASKNTGHHFMVFCRAEGT